MNNNNQNKIKSNKLSKENNNTNSQKFIENTNILDSLLKQKINSKKVIKFLNSEISNKIRDNISLDIFKNNASTVSSLLAKRNNIGVFKANNVSQPKIKIKKTVETMVHDNNLISPLHEYHTGVINTYKIKKNYYPLNNAIYFSPKNRNEEYGKEINNYKKYKKEISSIEEFNRKKNNLYYQNQFYEKNKLVKNKSLKNLSNILHNKYLKENYEDNVHQKGKRYMKNYNINDNIKNDYNIKLNTNPNNINLINEKMIYEKNKEKSHLLLYNYRKSLIKQFLHFLKPYYYSYIKKYFHQFISNIRKKEYYSNISAKKYNKKINKRNIKPFNELKSDQLNYSKNVLSNINNIENSNCISSYNSNSNKIQSEKKFLSPNKKINTFLINNNNLNFSTKGNLVKDELYRNNSELEKKYSQIMQRKKRKKILENEDYSISQIKNINKSIDIITQNKNYIINNIYQKKNNKLKNEYNLLSNTEIPKEDSVKIEKRKYIKKIAIPKRDNDKNIKIKKNKSNDKLTGNSSRYDKKQDFKHNIIIKVNKINRSEKFNNINNSPYNKNVITKTIKNIFTKDKKINIHINYVFLAPQNIIKKNKNIECLQISPIYSYNYIGNENKKNNKNKNKNKNKIYSKKKLTSIQEEE